MSCTGEQGVEKLWEFVYCPYLETLCFFLRSDCFELRSGDLVVLWVWRFMLNLILRSLSSAFLYVYFCCEFVLNLFYLLNILIESNIWGSICRSRLWFLSWVTDRMSSKGVFFGEGWILYWGVLNKVCLYKYKYL